MRIRKPTKKQIETWEKWSKEDGDKWENGQLGRSKVHTQKTPPKLEKELNELKKNKLISIKLPQDLINDLKNLAEQDNIGYQTLIKQVLSRYVSAQQRKKAM